MNESPTQPYVDFLRKEGYAPESRDNGTVVFKYQGWTYVIMLDSGDDEYFRLVLPNLYTVSDAASKREALVAVNHAVASTKVAKVYLADDGQVHGSLELFASSPAAVMDVLLRGLQALQAAGQSFAQSLREG